MRLKPDETHTQTHLCLFVPDLTLVKFSVEQWGAANVLSSTLSEVHQRKSTLCSVHAGSLSWLTGTPNGTEPLSMKPGSPELFLF